MKKLFYFVLILVIAADSLSAQSFTSVQQLAQRRVPWLAKHLVFSTIPQENGKAVFELSSQKGKIQIAASDANAAAVGLNRYLQDFCHRSMSHLGNNLSPVKNLPEVKETIRVVSPYAFRYALNYCTINYTMSFYTWKDWERELDWLALNGFNLVLMPVGTEKAWQNTLQQIGYSDKEIKDFIPGPAFTAWWLMGNLEGWGGAVSQTMIDQQAVLAQKIIARMKEFNIEPVLQGFYSMVPTSLKTKFPQANIIEQGEWAGGFTRPAILLPQDSLYKRLAGIYYHQIKKLYGKDLHYFGGEPFHEGGKSKGIDVTEAARIVQQTMQEHFPNSTWVLQGWGANPTAAFLEKLDKKHTLVIELFGENTRNWEKRKGYENTPFIWSTVSNFGEKLGLYGRLQRFANEVDFARNSQYGPLLKGIGIIPEGLNNNPVVYDFMASLGWKNSKADPTEWIKNYVRYRYGVENENLQKAWQLFLQTVYSSPEVYQEGPSESIFCARPALDLKKVSCCGTIIRRYDTALFEKAVQLFVAAGGSTETYKTDKIDFLRQLNAHRADMVYQQMCDAVRAKDKTAFLDAYNRFEKMLLEQDKLLGTSEHFSLNRWLEQAKNFGANKEDKQLALWNAKAQITYWGPVTNPKTELHEYAHKEWGGLLASLYLQRWRLFKADMLTVIDGGKATADYFEVEKRWAAER